MATIETTEMLTPDQAAALLNKGLPKAKQISAHTIRRYCLNHETNVKQKLKEPDKHTPEIEAMRFGRSWQIKRSEIERYKKERRGKGRPAD